MDIWRKHRPLHGGGSHVQPDEARALITWNGLSYEMTGTAPTLAAAQQWVTEAQAPRPQTSRRHCTGPATAAVASAVELISGAGRQKAWDWSVNGCGGHCPSRRSADPGGCRGPTDSACASRCAPLGGQPCQGRNLGHQPGTARR
ncbi:DUF6087 family protein [Streptomyces sp. NPDC005132]|uniref:DUF6087 family protein n=1 Tax=Streptomyces sp. NPDC005132 TaxID=3154294 RepID=UPI0033BCB465